MGRFMRRTKYVFHVLGVRHFVLLLLYAVFLFFGAFIFYGVESENEYNIRRSWLIYLEQNRTTFIRESILPSIFNNNDLLVHVNGPRSMKIEFLLQGHLKEYERKLKVKFPDAGPLEWTFANSVVYAASLVTTIGYDHVYPLTRVGIMVSMVYALIGIPFTLILLRDWSRLIAKCLSYPGIVLLKIWDLFRFCTLKSVESIEDLKSERNHLSVKRKLFRHSVLRIPTIVAFLATFGCILAGSFAFCAWETEWSTLVSFYFCFASLTTIGPAANVLPQDSFMLACMLAYIYFGLAIVSLFIDFVYAKVLYAYTPTDQFYPALSDLPQFSQNTDYSTLLGTVSDENSHVSTGARTLDIDDYESSAALGSCVTLGVLQMNRRLHEEDLSRKRRQRDSKYCQTTISVPVRRHVLRVDQRDSLKPRTYVASSIATSSSDDVNRLIRESYSYRNRNLVNDNNNGNLCNS